MQYCTGLNYAFPPSSDRRGSRLDSCGSLISNANMVSTCAETCFRYAESGSSAIFAKARESTSVNINVDGGFQVVMEHLTGVGISTETAEPSLVHHGDQVLQNNMGIL